MMKKVFALLLALMMVLGMGTASADTNKDQIGKYYKVSDETGTLASVPNLEEGSTQNIYGNGLVKLNKTIAPTNTENVFDITLEVVTAQKIEERSVSEDAAAILVIDTSGSMNNKLSNGNTRMTEAKKAAQTFINAFAESDAQRKVAIVTIGATATVLQSWTDAKNLLPQAGASLHPKISGITAVGVTNIEAALTQARTALDSTALQGISNKNIILLSDGIPTRHSGAAGSNGDGNVACHLCHVNVENVMASYPSDIDRYAIYVGPEKDVLECKGGVCNNSSCKKSCGYKSLATTWLQEECGFATYATQDASKLVQLFENISLQIVSRAQAWIVNDPMGSQIDYVDVVSADKNAFKAENDEVIWDLKEDKTYVYDEASQLYTYTATYRVLLDTLKAGFEEGTFYPTNGVTPLTWVVLDEKGNIVGADQPDAGIKKAYFNVPSVKGYTAQIKKVDEDGNPLEGARFELQHSCKDCGSSSTAWNKITGDSDKNGIVVFAQGAAVPSGHTYTLTEKVAPVGYVLDSAAKSIAVSYGSIDQNDPLVIPNELLLTEATVKKVWDDADNQDGKRPDSLTVTLSDGTEVTLNEANGWTATVKDLPKYEAGKLIEYTWTEGAVPEGYTLSGTAKEGTVTTLTNSYKPEEISVTVKKVWDDADNQDGKRPASLIVALSNGLEVTLNESNGWMATINNLPKYAAGKLIEYSWSEKTVPAGYQMTGNVTEGTVTTITNTHEIEKVVVEGTKTWVGDTEDMRPASITINLLADGVWKESMTVTAADGWAWAFENLDKYKAGKEIVYTVTEDPIDYYLTEIDGYNVINTRKVVNGKSFPVTKVIEQIGEVAPVPGTYTFDFTVTARKTEVLVPRDAQTVPNDSVTFQFGDDGDVKTVKIGESAAFSIPVEVTKDGTSWKNSTSVTYWINDEDNANVAFDVVETSAAPKFWSYDNTTKTVSQNALEAGAVVVNEYDEGYLTKSFPFSKTVLKHGNVKPGVQTFYFAASLAFDNAVDFDELDAADKWPEIKVIEKDMVVDHGYGLFAITVNGKDTVDAMIEVTYPESVPMIGVYMYELTSMDESVTMEELREDGWIYDKTAEFEINEFGYPEHKKMWRYFFEGDRVVNPDMEEAEKIEFVNIYYVNERPPQTGDNSNAALWIALMAVSALCFVALSKRRSA